VGARLVVNTRPAITLADLTIAYERHPAIHHLTGCFDEGSLTAIVGPNGAGKSSLVRAIAGLQAPSSGHIDLHGRKAHDIAYLPQLAAIDETFPISVRDSVLFGHWRRVGAFGTMTNSMVVEAEETLGRVGLAGFADRAFGSLSAGQRQRALFARLIVADCPIILLDEPFSAIDERTVEALMRLILGWHQEGRTILAVLHSIDLVQRHFPRTLLLAREAIAWGPTGEALTVENLRRSGALNAAWVADSELCREGA